MPLQVSVPSKSHLPIPAKVDLKGAKELLVWDDADRDGVRELMIHAERQGVTIVGKTPAAQKYMSVIFTGA
ncbi:MAG: hypothetical protein AAB919_00670 [Patescibacteria group bacterium]|mgnify:CR=1 FL=1